MPVISKMMAATDRLTWWPMVYVYWRPDQWSRTAFMWTFRGFAPPQSITTCFTLGFQNFAFWKCCQCLGSRYPSVSHSMSPPLVWIWWLWVDTWFVENFRNQKSQIEIWNKIILPINWEWCWPMPIVHALNLLQIFASMDEIPKIKLCGAIFVPWGPLSTSPPC